MTTSEESERRIAEALRARATGAGFSGPAADHPGGSYAGGRHSSNGSGSGSGSHNAAAVTAGTDLRSTLADVRFALLLALLCGVLMGVGLALLSVLAPGVLPPLG